MAQRAVCSRVQCAVCSELRAVRPKGWPPAIRDASAAAAVNGPPPKWEAVERAELRTYGEQKAAEKRRRGQANPLQTPAWLRAMGF